MRAGKFSPKVRLEPVSLSGAVDGEPNIRSSKGQSKQHKLEQEPAPAAAAAAVLWPRCAASCLLAGLGGGSAVLHVKVLRAHANDIVVVRQLTSLRRKAEVGHRGHFVVLDFEALGPFIFLLVLQLELEGLVGEVGKAGFRGDSGITDTPGLCSMLATRLCSCITTG